jgi:hypothetical protein
MAGRPPKCDERRRSPLHPWEAREDSNGRAYLACKRCDVVVHEWEGGFMELAAGVEDLDQLLKRRFVNR